MQRYFIEKNQIVDNELIITNTNDVHHMQQVMRMILGTQIVCTDEHEQAYLCIITAFSDTEVHATIEELLDNTTELPVTVTIFQGLPKKNKLELIIQKGTELGCSHFGLFPAARSVVKWDNKKTAQNVDRFRRIAKEASEQSERGRVPDVEAHKSLENILIHKDEYDVLFFAYAEAARSADYHSFATALSKCRPGMRMGIFIGPEGGFSENEVALFQHYKIQSIRLGARILRTETAPIYALSCISYHFEEMG